VLSTDVLFVGVASNVPLVTTAVLTSITACVGVPAIVTCADAPAASDPSWQVTVPVPWAHAVPTTLVTLKPAGSVSVSTTPVAGSGPLFVTASV
jgi:hypothetical protein